MDSVFWCRLKRILILENKVGILIIFRQTDKITLFSMILPSLKGNKYNNKVFNKSAVKKEVFHWITLIFDPKQVWNRKNHNHQEITQIIPIRNSMRIHSFWEFAFSSFSVFDLNETRFHERVFDIVFAI